MTAASRWLLATLLVAAALCGKLEAAPPAPALPNRVRGRVVLPDGSLKKSDVLIVVVTSSGSELRGYCDRDGYFSLGDVPAGAHHLQVFGRGLFFPEVRIEVAPGGRGGLVHASLAAARGQMLPLDPLLLQPGAVAAYYEKRKPLDLWSIIKSPYGMMVAFMLFGIIVFPRLKVDPEEYKEFQEQLRGGSGGGGGEQRERIEAPRSQAEQRRISRGDR